jgi:hypothetical protein
VGDVEGCRGERLDPAVDGNTPDPDDDVAKTTTDCEGTSDDDGILFIRVQRSAFTEVACAYNLWIAVE